MSISRVFVDAALKAQRKGWARAALPASVRRRLRAAGSVLIRRSTGDLVDDWSLPLLGTSSRQVMPMSAAAPAEAVHPLSADAGRANSELHRDAPRCLLVTNSLNVNGMDEMVAFLALRLRFHGLRTAVLVASDQGVKGRLAGLLSAVGVEVVIAEEPAARQWIRRWSPDVISANDAPSWVLDHARSLAVPYVEVLHGMYALFDCDWTAQAERSRDMAAIVAVSEIVRRQYLRGVRTLPGERVVTISNGVDPSRRVPHDRSAARRALGIRDEFLFLCLARYDSNKNQFGIVSAFDEVAARHPEAHLLMAGPVGEPVYCTQVRQAQQKLGARDRVHMRDHAGDPALLFAAADGFVLNSFFEGGPLVTMEALHAGVPVVASDVGGVRDQLGTDASRGYLIPNPLGDPLEANWATIGSACYESQMNRDDLIDAMSALIVEREQRETKRHDLAAESADRFHPDHCVRAHANLLHSCVNGDMSRDIAGDALACVLA